MTDSRSTILGKLRAARRPFEDAPPRPAAHLPALAVEDSSREALVARFVREMALLKGEAFVVRGDAGARDKIRALIAQHKANHALTWDFGHIPVDGLAEMLHEMGVEATIPLPHQDRSPEVMAHFGQATIGISGVDAAIALTGTLILSSGEGKGRIPTVLPPIWIAVVSAEQIVPRLEDWLASERARGMQTVYERANLAFVTGPSRTGDIEMELILGVHGPGTEYVIIKDIDMRT
jgi:L-lactate dehydrogenase complex protein LldG